MSHASAAAVKDLLPYRARVVLGHLSRRARYAAMVLAGKAKADQQCSVCGRELGGFVHGGKLCPFCTSFPRHRMFWPLLRSWLDAAAGPVPLLLVAPDMSLRARLVEHPKAQYRGVDMFTPGHYYPPDTEDGDITGLRFKDGEFDLVICSHVLEHVPRDDLALSELFRVLKPGGLALLCFPFRPGTRTHEDPSITSPEDRAREFGQWDHVRYYGEDAADRMQAAGFEVRKLQASDIYSTAEVQKFALQAGEVFFVCRKPGSGSALAKVTLDRVTPS